MQAYTLVRVWEPFAFRIGAEEIDIQFFSADVSSFFKNMCIQRCCLFQFNRTYRGRIAGLGCLNLLGTRLPQRSVPYAHPEVPEQVIQREDLGPRLHHLRKNIRVFRTSRSIQNERNPLARLAWGPQNPEWVLINRLKLNLARIRQMPYRLWDLRPK
jgi:hypothetical protein